MANILVIDDDVDIRPMMKLLLTRLGHIPTLAGRGEEGLAAAQVGNFDLVILDLMMPDLDGYEVTRRLRANPHTRDLPILIFTARTQPADEEMALEAGADAYLPKMSEPQDLSAKIAELLKAGRARKSGETPTASAPAATPPSQAAQAPAPIAPGHAGPTAPMPAGRVIVALGLRGGVGTTTVAVNLAGALLRSGKRVCLVDLSPSTGHVTLQLRLRTHATWADLPPAPDPVTTGQALTRHESGLYVLAAPAQPVRRSLPGETFLAALNMLRGSFAEVVIDAAHMLDDSTCAALAAAHSALVVLSPEVGAVHTVVATMRSLDGLAVADNRVRFVLNQLTLEPGLPPAAIERALGRPPDLMIPYDRAQPVALSQGTPLVFLQPNMPLPSAIGSFAAKL